MIGRQATELYHLFREERWKDMFPENGVKYLDWLFALQGQAEQITDPSTLPAKIIQVVVKRGHTAVIKRLTKSQLDDPSLIKVAIPEGYTDLVELLPGALLSRAAETGQQAAFRLMLPRETGKDHSDIIHYAAKRLAELTALSV